MEHDPPRLDYAGPAIQVDRMRGRLAIGFGCGVALDVVSVPLAVFLDSRAFIDLVFPYLRIADRLGHFTAGAIFALFAELPLYGIACAWMSERRGWWWAAAMLIAVHAAAVASVKLLHI